jgi:hypothetical protein
MEQFLDYRMVDHHLVVEQTHEVLALAKEFKGCNK